MFKQGVGETLRGTLNNEVDSRFSRHDPDKAAAANAKNRATLEAGQREMAGLRNQRGLNTTVSTDPNKDLPYLPQQPNYTYHPNAPPNSNLTALPSKDSRGYMPPHGTAVEPDHYYTDQQGSQSDGREPNSYDTASNSINYPASSSQPEEKRGLRKLLKRRP